jgi:hypothetical protein
MLGGGGLEGDLVAEGLELGNGLLAGARFSSIVAATGHAGLIRYRGLSAVQTGVSQIARERQGRSYAFLATSFQAMQASRSVPSRSSGTEPHGERSQAKTG